MHTQRRVPLPGQGYRGPKGGDGYYAPFFVLGRGDACRTVPFTMLGALIPDIAFIGISASIRPATVPIRSIKDSLQWPAFGVEGVD